MLDCAGVQVCFARMLLMTAATKSRKKGDLLPTDPVRQRISDFMGDVYRERLHAGKKTSVQLALETRSARRKKTKPKSSPISLPKRIKIRRGKGYHTHHVGKCTDGTQFMAFIVATKPPAGKRMPKWYAVVHRFDSSGKHLGTEACFLGAKAFAKDLDHPTAKLINLIRRLGSIIYCDIMIQLFSVDIDGNTFGLVDASFPKKITRGLILFLTV